jgi:hypothetical protein
MAAMSQSVTIAENGRRKRITKLDLTIGHEDRAGLGKQRAMWA